MSKSNCTHFVCLLFECAPVSVSIGQEIIPKLGVKDRPLIVSHQKSKFTQFLMLSVDLTQDSCTPAAVIQLCLRLAHSEQRIMCGGILDWAVLSVSLFIQVQQSSCQCCHVFITEGNPTTEPRLSYVLSSYTASTSASARQLVSLCPSPPLLLSVWFFLPPGVFKCVFLELLVMSCHQAVCYSLRAMAFAGRVVVGDILSSMTRCRSVWQLCCCCYFSVREGRVGARRCPDHVSDTMASGRTL